MKYISLALVTILVGCSTLQPNTDSNLPLLVNTTTPTTTDSFDVKAIIDTDDQLDEALSDLETIDQLVQP